MHPGAQAIALAIRLWSSQWRSRRRAARKALGRKRVALVYAGGTWLAMAAVPGCVQDGDCLRALTAGKEAWPSLRDRAGRLDVYAARLACAAVLSGAETLVNPMPPHAKVR